MYWIDVINKMKGFTVGTMDVRDIDSVTSGSITPGIYVIFASGSFYSEWTGEKWESPKLELEMRKQWNRANNIEGEY